MKRGEGGVPRCVVDLIVPALARRQGKEQQGSPMLSASSSRKRSGPFSRFGKVLELRSRRRTSSCPAGLGLLPSSPLLQGAFPDFPSSTFLSFLLTLVDRVSVFGPLLHTTLIVLSSRVWTRIPLRTEVDSRSNSIKQGLMFLRPLSYADS